MSWSRRAHHVLLVAPVGVGPGRGLQRVGQPVDREPAVVAVEQREVLEHAVGQPPPANLTNSAPIIRQSSWVLAAMVENDARARVVLRGGHLARPYHRDPPRRRQSLDPDAPTAENGCMSQEPDAELASHLERMKRDGYTIVERVIDDDTVAALRDDVRRLERELATRPAANVFEGVRTLRIYNLLVHGAIYHPIRSTHACCRSSRACSTAAAWCRRCRRSTSGRASAAQPLHADDQLIPLPKPHVSIICNTMVGADRLHRGQRRDPAGARHAPRRPLAAAVRRARQDHRRRDAGRQRAGVRRLDLAQRRRQPDRRVAARHRDELLRRLAAPAGEPAARHPGRDRARVSAAAAQAGRLRPVQGPARPHRQGGRPSTCLDGGPPTPVVGFIK